MMSMAAYGNDAEKWKLFETGLPVMFVETVGGELPTAEPAVSPDGSVTGAITNRSIVMGRVFILNENRDTIYDSGEYAQSESGMTIRLRGNWSSRIDKTQYKLKLEKKADLIDGNPRKADRNWVLKIDENMYPCVIPSLKVNELIGLQWTPRYKWIHLVLNDSYRGLYQLIENVRRNPDCRIDVSKSGYIIEYDAYYWNEDVWFETPLHNLYRNITFSVKYPDSDDITESQLKYIADYMSTAEQSFKDGNYAQYVDVKSFARWLIGADILGVKDCYGFNMFVTKYDDTSQSLIKMANMWDYDTILKTAGQWSLCHTFFYFGLMFSSSDNTFTDTYIRIWEEEGHSVIDSTINYIRSYVDSSIGRSLARSMAIDHKRWPCYYVNLDAFANSVISWLQDRKVWMDNEVAKMKAQVAVKPVKGDMKDSQVQYYDILGRKVLDCDGKPVKYSKDGRTGLVIGSSLTF